MRFQWINLDQCNTFDVISARLDHHGEYRLRILHLIASSSTQTSVQSRLRVHVEDMPPVGWSEGPWGLVIRVKAIRVGVGLIKIFDFVVYIWKAIQITTY